MLHERLSGHTLRKLLLTDHEHVPSHAPGHALLYHPVALPRPEVKIVTTVEISIQIIACTTPGMPALDTQPWTERGRAALLWACTNMLRLRLQQVKLDAVFVEPRQPNLRLH